MATLTIIISLISALIGASVNGIFNRFLAKKQNRLQMTLHIYEDYNSKDMMESRHKASALLSANLKSENPLTMKTLKDTLSVEEFYHIARVVRFVEKLIMLSEYNQLDAELTRRLLSRDLSNWYDVYLEKYYTLERNSDSKWIPLAWAVKGLQEHRLLVENKETSLQTKSVSEN